MADAMKVRSSLITGWCCSGMQPAPRVCTLTLGFPHDVMDDKAEVDEDPSHIEKFSAMQSQLPNLCRSLAREVEGLKLRMLQCEESLGGRSPARTGHVDQSSLFRIVDDVRVGQERLKGQVSEYWERMRSLSEKDDVLEKLIANSIGTQTSIERRLEELSVEVKELASVADPLAMGGQLCKTLNSNEWGALFAEARRDIAECKQRIDDIALDDGMKHGHFKSPDDTVNANVPSRHGEVTRAAKAAVRDTTPTPEQWCASPQAPTPPPPKQASHTTGADKWRPLPVMKPLNVIRMPS